MNLKTFENKRVIDGIVMMTEPTLLFSASNTEVVNNLQMIQKTNTLTVATIRLSLGTNNTRYRVTCKITTGEGLQYERSVFVRVKEK